MSAAFITAVGGARKDRISPALAAALALHVGVFVLVTLLSPAPPLALGGAVPINIVSDAPASDSAPALQAPQTHPAATPTPADRGNPVPAAVAAPPPPRPTAAPPAKAPKTAPTTPSLALAPPRSSFSLDALAASVAKAAAADRARAGRAPPGATRSRTAAEVRVDAGQGVAQSDMQGLQQLLERLWNPNCSVEGADAVVVPVKFSVGDDGRLAGRVTGSGEGSSADPVISASARRAIDAVHQAEPYGAPYRGKSFTVIFDARKACADR